MKTLIVIGGPTASGKTCLAIEIARAYQTEIISADSRQVYREMEIGTAKPSEEELKQVPHHFINSHSIHRPLNAGEYEREAMKTLENLFTNHDTVLAVGGSGLYIKALTEGLDEMPEISEEIRNELNDIFESSGLEPLLEELQSKDEEYYRQVDTQNPRRVIRALEIIRSSGMPYSLWRKHINTAKSDRPFQTIMIGISPERKLLYQQIEKRIDKMIENGLIEEAKRLLPFRHLSSLQTVGYSEVFDYLEGMYDREECIRLLKRNTRRYAKRQLTWFRNQEEMIWFNSSEPQPVMGYLEAHLTN